MDEEKRFEELLGSYSEKAKDMLSEEGKVEEILKKAEETLAGIPNVGEKASKLPLMHSSISLFLSDLEKVQVFFLFSITAMVRWS